MLVTVATIGLLVLAIIAVVVGVVLGRDDRGEEPSGTRPPRTDETSR